MLIVGETGCQVYRDSLYYPCNFSISLKLLNKKFKKETKLQIKLKTVKKKKKSPHWCQGRTATIYDNKGAPWSCANRPPPATRPPTSLAPCSLCVRTHVVCPHCF